MSVGDRTATLYAEAEKLARAGQHDLALRRFQQVLARTQPLEAEETPEAYFEPYQGEPAQFDEAETRTHKGKPVRLVVDYFTAALYHCGYLFAATGQVDEAKKYLEQAALLWPKNVTIVRELAQVYERAGELSNALALLQEATEQHPESAALHHDLAWLYNEVGRPGEAIVAARAAIALDPQPIAAYEELCAAHEKLGQHAQAEAVRLEVARRTLA